MTKSELTALGLPEASIKKFQDIYHRDLHKGCPEDNGRTNARS